MHSFSLGYFFNLKGLYTMRIPYFGAVERFRPKKGVDQHGARDVNFHCRVLDYSNEKYPDYPGGPPGPIPIGESLYLITGPEDAPLLEWKNRYISWCQQTFDKHGQLRPGKNPQLVEAEQKAIDEEFNQMTLNILKTARKQRSIINVVS
jgi:hypothetical protein